MTKDLGIRAALDMLDDIDAPTVARARFEAEVILLRYTNPRVALAYRKALERGARKASANARIECETDANVQLRSDS